MKLIGLFAILSVPVFAPYPLAATVAASVEASDGPRVPAIAGPSATGRILLSSWFTDRSSRYARIYKTYEDETAGAWVTTWNNGAYAQNTPAYSGVQEIAHSDNWVYLKTNNFPTHIMGPWYNDTGPGGSEEVFRNWPSNQELTMRIPRFPTIPANRSGFPPGIIGLMVDGTEIFSSSDTFSWDNAGNGTGNGNDTGPGAQGGGMGDGIWNHDAYVTESNTFDKSNAHAAGDQLHYHASPAGIRYLLGDNVTYDPDGNIYTGILDTDPAFNDRHSPIIGWLLDGFPLYGPYGYDDPNPSSTSATVRRMVSGFVPRDGARGTYNLTSNGRDRLPDWAAGIQGIGPNLSINQQGPDTASVDLGYFMEDNAYLGDLINPSDGQVYEQGVDFDLNAQNARWGRTPEFPDGVWAYFTSLNSNGDPSFPYNVVQQYQGSPSGGSIANIAETVTVYFQGGALKEESAAALAIDANDGDFVIVWDVIEGGSYTTEYTTDFATWNQVNTFTAASDREEVVDTGALQSDQGRIYRIVRDSIAAYDDPFGFGGGSEGGVGGDGPAGSGDTSGGIESIDPETIQAGSANVQVAITLLGSATPPLPPNQAVPVSVTIGAINASNITRDIGTGIITATFSIPSGITPQDYALTVTFNVPVYTRAAGIAITAP